MEQISFAPTGAAVVALQGGGRAIVDLEGSNMIDQVYSHTLAGNVTSTNFFYEEATDTGAATRRLADGSVVFTSRFEEIYPYGYGANPPYSSDGRWALTAGEAVDAPVMVFEIEGDRRYEIDAVSVFEGAVGIELDDNSRFMTRPAPGGQRLFFSAIDLSTGAAHAVWIESATGRLVAGPIELPSLGPGIVLDDGRVVMGSSTVVTILPADLEGPLVTVSGTEGFSVFDLDRATGTILIGATDGRVGLVDVETATVEFLESASGALTAGAFSPDGSRVAVLSVGKGAQIVDVATGRRVGIQMPLTGTFIYPAGLQWSEDGAGVWVGAPTGPIRLAANAEAWRAVACRVVHRELTSDEWVALVSDAGPQVPACS